jgi:WD40 repeat protein
LLDELSKFDPQLLQQHLAKLQSEHKQATDQAAQLRSQAAQADARAANIQKRIEMLNILLKGRQPKPASGSAPASGTARADEPPADMKAAAATPAPQAPPTTPEQKPPPPKSEVDPKTEKAAPVMKAASDEPPATPPQSPAKTMAAAPSQPPPKPALLNYEEHVKPILLEKCASCHNPDRARGGLILDSFTALMQGGSSGPVIAPGDPGSSRLWRLVDHQEKPFMPFEEPKLPDATLATIRAWIEQGALPDPNAKPAPPKPAPPAQPTGANQPPPSAKAVLPKAGPVQLARRTTRPTPVTALAASPVAPIVAVSGYRQILIHHLEDHRLLAAWPFEEGRIEDLTFSPDGVWLVAAGGDAGKSGQVVVFDVVTGTRVAEVGLQYDAVLRAAIDPYRELVASGGSNRKVRVHDLLINEPAYEIDRHNEWITALAFSPDATLLATADRAGEFFVWEAETGRLMHILRGHDHAIHDLAFSRDSNTLYSAGDEGTVRMWSMDNGKLMKQIRTHNSATLAIDVAPDGRLLTGGTDGPLELWKPDGAVMRQLPRLDDWTYSACFDASGKQLIAGSWTGRIHVFSADTAESLWQFDTNPAPSQESEGVASVSLGDHQAGGHVGLVQVRSGKIRESA